ncbi:hypothetical protein FJZ23_00745 [Candidatus Parcubacteria bacterium]|nr:hypothetical protein [Candidatus Parcubacteria bacterium]
MTVLLDTTEGRLLADSLFRIGVVEIAGPDEEGFLLKLHERSPDAPRSPFYLNLRTPENPNPGPLSSFACKAIGIAIKEMLVAHRFYGVCGIPHAGESLARAFTHLNLNTDAYVYYAPSHLAQIQTNGRRRIEPLLPFNPLNGEAVLVLDDVITQADTKIEAITALRSMGATVRHLAVVVDREQGGEQALQEHGVKVHALFTIRALLAYYRQAGAIPEEAYRRAIAYLEDNR